MFIHKVNRFEPDIDRLVNQIIITLYLHLCFLNTLVRWFNVVSVSIGCFLFNLKDFLVNLSLFFICISITYTVVEFIKTVKKEPITNAKKYSKNNKLNRKLEKTEPSQQKTYHSVRSNFIWVSRLTWLSGLVDKP